MIQHEHLGGDAVLASRLFCLHRAASRDAPLFKENFYSIFFAAVSHFLYIATLAVHGALLIFNTACSSQ